jgi:hypothetical protein
MTTAEIGKFLVVCALASELYFPPYQGAACSKNTKLNREAGHYKVKSERALREAKNKISAKSPRAKPDYKLQTSARSVNGQKAK